MVWSYRNYAKLLLLFWSFWRQSLRDNNLITVLSKNRKNRTQQLSHESELRHVWVASGGILSEKCEKQANTVHTATHNTKQNGFNDFATLTPFDKTAGSVALARFRCRKSYLIFFIGERFDGLQRAAQPVQHGTRAHTRRKYA